MADTAPTKQTRSDEAIEADIHHMLRTFAPTSHDRHQLVITVNEGNVTVKGYVKSRPAFDFIQGSLPRVQGVKSVNTDQLYNDESLRIAVGKIVPFGVYVNMEYGAVILDGKLPEGTTVEDVVKKVALIPGVRRVLTVF